MKKLSDKARLHARSYGQPPYGREIEGTADLLLQMAEKLENNLQQKISRALICPVKKYTETEHIFCKRK